MKLTLPGLAIGMVGAFALARVLRALLFGVTTTDAVMFIGGAIVMARSGAAGELSAGESRVGWTPC